MTLKPWMGAGLVALILLGASALDAEAKSVAPENTPAAAVEFEGNLLEKVTDEWLLHAKRKYATQFAWLKQLNDENGFPDGTLQTMWVIESMCGELNIKNKSGYDGHFQLGPYEAKKYGCDNPKDFECAARATVRLLRDYHMQFQRYAAAPVDWSQRTMADFYDLHRSGFRGAAAQYNVIMHGASYEEAVFVRNMRANVPTKVRPLLFDSKGRRAGSMSDRDLTILFYKIWAHQMNHIWMIIK